MFGLHLFLFIRKRSASNPKPDMLKSLLVNNIETIFDWCHSYRFSRSLKPHGYKLLNRSQLSSFHQCLLLVVIWCYGQIPLSISLSRQPIILTRMLYSHELGFQLTHNVYNSKELFRNDQFMLGTSATILQSIHNCALLKLQANFMFAHCLNMYILVYSSNLNQAENSFSKIESAVKSEKYQKLIDSKIAVSEAISEINGFDMFGYCKKTLAVSIRLIFEHQVLISINGI